MEKPHVNINSKEKSNTHISEVESSADLESKSWRDMFQFSMRHPKPAWAVAALALQLLNTVGCGIKNAQIGEAHAETAVEEMHRLDRKNMHERAKLVPSMEAEAGDAKLMFVNWEQFSGKPSPHKIQVESKTLQRIIGTYKANFKGEENGKPLLQDADTFDIWMMSQAGRADIMELASVEDIHTLTPTQAVELAVAVAIKNLDYDLATDMDVKNQVEDAGTSIRLGTGMHHIDEIEKKHMPVECTELTAASVENFNALKRHHPELANTYMQRLGDTEMAHAFPDIIQVTGPREAEISVIDVTLPDKHKDKDKWFSRLFPDEDFLQLLNGLSEAKVISLKENIHLARDYMAEKKSDSYQESKYVDYLNGFAKLYEAYPADMEADLSWNQADRDSFQEFGKANAKRYERDAEDTLQEKKDIKAILHMLIAGKDNKDTTFDKAYLDKVREQLKSL